MAFAGPTVVVDGPPVRPPANGLLSAATVVDVPDDRRIGGESFAPSAAGSVILYDLCSSDGTVALASPVTHARFNAPSFATVISDRCSTFGFGAAAYEEHARAGDLVKSGWGVERQFEQDALGIGADFDSLAEQYTANANNAAAGATTQIIAGGSALTPLSALARLDQAIASAAIGLGIIHAMPFIVDLWAANLLITAQAGKLYSPNGNLIAAGNGYQGKSPDTSAYADPVATAAGVVWAYATDLITIDRGPLDIVPGQISEAVDRRTNDVRYLAQRVWTIRWARQLHAAAKIAFTA